MSITFYTSDETRKYWKYIKHCWHYFSEVVDRSSCLLNFNKRKRKEKESLGEQKSSLNNDRLESDGKRTIATKSKKQKRREEKKSFPLLDNCETKLCQLEPKAKKKKLIRSCDTISNENVTSDFNNLTESDLIILLKKNSYPGLSKLRWDNIKKKCNVLLKRSNVCTGKKKQLLIRKAINVVRKSL